MSASSSPSWRQELSPNQRHSLNPFCIEDFEDVVGDDSDDDHLYLDKYNSDDYNDVYDSFDEDEFLLDGRSSTGRSQQRHNLSPDASRRDLHSRRISDSLFLSLFPFRIWDILFQQTPSPPRRFQVLLTMASLLMILLLLSSQRNDGGNKTDWSTPKNATATSSNFSNFPTIDMNISSRSSPKAEPNSASSNSHNQNGESLTELTTAPIDLTKKQATSANTSGASTSSNNSSNILTGHDAKKISSFFADGGKNDNSTFSSSEKFIIP